MLESIVYDEVFSRACSYILPNQHGFFRGRNVETNLVPYVQNLTECLDRRTQVDAVYTDFSKVFDTVHHNTLAVKLENFGVHGCLLRWIKSYYFE